jgi:hypothetical protein
MDGQEEWEAVADDNHEEERKRIKMPAGDG